MAAMYLLLEAPDVAMTEAAVGAGISTLVIVATLLHTGRHDDVPRKGRKAVLVLVACIGAVLAMAMHDLPHIGDVNAPVIRRELPGGTPSTNGYYLDATQRDIAIPNVVTAVLASYRAYDTLGETAVVFTAMLAVLLILWPGLQRLLGGPKGGDHA
jgi:multicomponent Na+:H+ antiporter subunit B